MNRRTLSILALGALLAGVVLMAHSAALAADAANNTYATDFTKTMGNWKLDKAEGKQVDGEGVKITSVKKLGGLAQEGNKGPDVSATPVVLIELVNAKDEVKLMVKVKGGKDAYTYEKLPAVAKGKSTLKVNLKDTGIDLTKFNYMRIMSKAEGDCDLTIKSISFVKGE
jgi:hypothetical protein